MPRSSITLLTVLVIIGAALIAGGAWYWRTSAPPIGGAVTSFEDCVAAGYPVMESYPEQCRTPDGQTFVRALPKTSSLFPDQQPDLIRLHSPQANQTVSDPISITGQARGIWFFEASFPLRLYTPDGALLATSFAQAEGEWMTEEFVPFRAELDVPDTVSGPAVLVLEKDNPSGLAEHANSISIPITIAR